MLTNKIKIFPENCRGDKILSIYWFAIIIIVTGGVFAMVYVYYGTPYDVRDIESTLLTNHVADCVSYAGKINTNLISKGEISKDNQTFLDTDCNLIFSSEEWKDSQYYSEVSFYKITDSNNAVLDIRKGNNNWRSYCTIQKDSLQDRLVKCNQKSFYSVDDLGNQYIIKILSIVRKSEKNVKV
ncbi:Uncharacterised protein [uncultured archaeon]|nr:Uncharacterised protein [uncultured archaeon]